MRRSCQHQQLIYVLYIAVVSVSGLRPVNELAKFLLVWLGLSKVAVNGALGVGLKQAARL